MKFGSKASAFMVICRGAEPILHPATGVRVGFQRPLIAEFAGHFGEYTPVDKDGETVKDMYGQPYVAADIRGHFWDSEAWQQELGATDEERELLENRVLAECKREPSHVWLLEEQKITVPWPTYESTHAAKIPGLAAELGLVEQTLAYERQNKNRDSVTEKLEAALAESRDDTQAEKELTVVA